MDVAAVVPRIPASSTPAVFHASVARWNSRNPTSVASSLACSGGSGRPWSSKRGSDAVSSTVASGVRAS